MEQNMPIIAKKFWHMVKVVLFMLRKGISKGKLMIDLNMLMKRGKIAGKAIQNLMFHHGHNWAASAFASFDTHRRSHDKPQSDPSVEYYEFSCSNSPSYPSFLQLHGGKRRHHFNLFSRGAAAQEPSSASTDDEMAMHAVMKALELLNSGNASPALPGFGKSPMVRQLRITDSPFPLRDVEVDNHVDEAAEEFISKFYKDLRRQNAIAALMPC